MPKKINKKHKCRFLIYDKITRKYRRCKHYRIDNQIEKWHCLFCKKHDNKFDDLVKKIVYDNCDLKDYIFEYASFYKDYNDLGNNKQKR